MPDWLMALAMVSLGACFGYVWGAFLTKRKYEDDYR